MVELANGYTRIANELLEALAKVRVSGEASQMLRVIIRKTYGFQKKEATISTQEFMEETNLPRKAVHKARARLREMNIVSVPQKGYSQVLTYSIQKDYKKWKVYPKKGIPQKGYNCTPKRVRSVPQKGDTIIIKKKENSKERAEQFNILWKLYPRKLGKESAFKKFKVFTNSDVIKINTALKNYLEYIKTEGTAEQYISHGATFFSSKWKDWVDYEPTQKERLCNRL